MKSLRRVIGRPDRRLVWLKEQYLQLYYEDGRCLAPTMADAIRVLIFGISLSKKVFSPVTFWLHSLRIQETNFIQTRVLIILLENRIII